MTLFQRLLIFLKIKKPFIYCEEVLKRLDKNYEYRIFVDASGKLTYQDKHNKGRILGLCDWGTPLKDQLKINHSTTVLDVLILPEFPKHTNEL